ncbi:MAG: iron-sulfur cluster assembly scaffold protein [Candidatus Competibacteraceae bacterium]|nr:iron-sulfur cluster assembly scaffold protein [Candidatus Competibacteraceae bacterium]MBK8897986.1 iron-sulfur cluster assembly scaffold protein [Candidatus Competibacteraceae bacterium]
MLELSAAAREHFERPRHVGELAAPAPLIARSRVGEPASGDILQLQLRASAQGIIDTVRFKAYGCGWLIACGSLLSERLEGQSLEQARHFRHHHLVETLEIPPAKLHCAVLAETALKTALQNLSDAGASELKHPLA